MGSLTSPADHNSEDAGDGAYGLSSLSEYCGLFVRASVKETKREIFEILTARCLNCFLSVKSIALVGALAK